jgi:hypothetical protein
VAKKENGRGDHLVARTDAERPQRDHQGVGAGVEPDGVPHAQVGRGLASNASTSGP